MRNWIVLAITAVVLTTSACTREETDSAARKAGKTAHEIAKDTEIAAKKAGHELQEAAREAKQGWKEGGHESPEKKRE